MKARLFSFSVCDYVLVSDKYHHGNKEYVFDFTNDRLYKKMTDIGVIKKIDITSEMFINGINYDNLSLVSSDLDDISDMNIDEELCYMTLNGYERLTV